MAGERGADTKANEERDWSEPGYYPGTPYPVHYNLPNRENNLCSYFLPIRPCPSWATPMPLPRSAVCVAVPTDGGSDTRSGDYSERLNQSGGRLVTVQSDRMLMFNVNTASARTV